MGERYLCFNYPVRLNDRIKRDNKHSIPQRRSISFQRCYIMSPLEQTPYHVPL